MWVIAHRGGSQLYPENTLTAFRQAEALGVDMIECDVHVSRDGELMVIHDSTLDRTGGQSVRVADLTAQELAQVDVGQGQGVPTLREILSTLHIPVAVEIKTMAVVEGLLRLFASDASLVQRVTPLSFHHRAIKELTERVPGLEAGVLLVGAPVDLAHMVRAAGVRLASLKYDLVNRDLVHEMHREGILVGVWTVNDPAAIASMVDAHVDAIGSDRPDLVLKALGR